MPNPAALPFARYVDLTGMTFGRLAVIKRLPREPKKPYTWLCRCECGRERVVTRETLRSPLNLNCLRCRRKVNRPPRQLPCFCGRPARRPLSDSRLYYCEPCGVGFVAKPRGKGDRSKRLYLSQEETERALINNLYPTPTEGEAREPSEPIHEGKVKKGGQNPRPTTPRPAPPQGQSVMGEGSERTQQANFRAGE